MPVAFSLQPLTLHSPSPLWRQRQKHTPKRAFCSFYRKRQLYRHIYTTRARRAKGEVRPSLVAQVGREGSSVGKGVAASPLVAHSGTSCHTTRRLQKNDVNITKKGNRDKERGRRWGVETSSSLSLATVLALSVAGTQMSTLMGHHWAWGCASSRAGMARQAGALLPVHKSYQQEEGCGIFPRPLEEEERIF